MDSPGKEVREQRLQGGRVSQVCKGGVRTRTPNP